MADSNRGVDCADAFSSPHEPRGKSSYLEPRRPDPMQAAAPEEEELSVCTSSCMPPAMLRRSGWRVEQFKLHKQIYKGRTSRLYLATDIQSGTPVALKLYCKDKLTALNRVQVEREINIHRDLTHKNIIKLYAAFEDTKNVYLVLEVAEGGDLFSHVKTTTGQQYSERKAVLHVIIPFLNAMVYLHERGIIHRDIKPENILISSTGIIKLADFGLAIDLCEERPVTRLGTLDYMAPEVLVCPDKKLPEENKHRIDLVYSTQVDVWAVGILAYEILAGRAPFERDTRLDTLEHILTKEPDFPACISEEARKFIKATLVKDPNRRPSATMLMEHPWIMSYRRTMLSKAPERAGAAAPQEVDNPVPKQLPDPTAKPQPQADLGRSLTTPAAMPWSDLHVHISVPQVATLKHRLSCSTNPDAAASSTTPTNLSGSQISIFQNDVLSCQSSPANSVGHHPDRQGSASMTTFPPHIHICRPSNEQPGSSMSPRKLGAGSALVHNFPDSTSQSMPQDTSLPRLSTKHSLPCPIPYGASNSFTKPKAGVLSCDDSLAKMADSSLSLNLVALLSPTGRERSQPNLASGHVSHPGSAQSKPPVKTLMSKGISNMSLGLAALLSPGSKKPTLAPEGASRMSPNGTMPAEGWVSPESRDKPGTLEKTSAKGFPAKLFAKAISSRGRCESLGNGSSTSDLHVHAQSDPSAGIAIPVKPSSASSSSPQMTRLSPSSSLSPSLPKFLRAKVNLELLGRTDSSPQLHQGAGLMLR